MADGDSDMKESFGETEGGKGLERDRDRDREREERRVENYMMMKRMNQKNVKNCEE